MFRNKINYFHKHVIRSMHKIKQCQNSIPAEYPTGTVKRYFSECPQVLQPVKLAYASYESTFDDLDDKLPVIIMHGLLGSKNNWNSLSKVIHSRTKRKIITIDARNHGDSPHSGEFTYPHLAEDIRLLMSDLNIPKASVIGHSMGGRVLMFLALKYPQLVESLVVVDISPVRTANDITEMTQLFGAMLSIDLDFNVPLSQARKLADKQLEETVSDVYVRQFLLTNLVEVSGGHYKWRVNLDSVIHNFPEIIKFPIPKGTYDGPALFIGGRKSNFLKPEDHKSILKLFPNAEFEYIDGAGHWVHSDKPAQFLELVCEFINEV